MPLRWTVDCSTCEFFEGRCTLRDVSLTDPARTSCANHTSHTRKPDRILVGPVLQRDGDHSSIAHEAPDTDRIRRHLLAIVAAIDVVDADEMTFREAIALWHIDRLQDRRAFVHIDRISAAIAAPARGGLFELALAKGVFQRIAREDPERARDGTILLERLTIRGRVLLFGSLVAGCGAFFATFLLLYQNLPPGSRIPMTAVFAIAIGAGGLVLAIGVWTFRRLGVPFLNSERPVGRT